ncbi:hypothetical protein QAD02_024002 [Eretmocerus hayati]|uniref:Uncharacterized protein n=1 Tax=Eretmocerus hayati TaxID=131215 RepID=A0ACC2PXK6_9HYME|nr:hypothetical protein QAD02_024002 [Eretmocerus hayati]
MAREREQQVLFSTASAAALLFAKKTPLMCLDRKRLASCCYQIDAEKSKSDVSHVEKKCIKCLSSIARGLSHTCNESTRIENLKALLSSTSDKSRQIVVSSELRDLIDQRDKSESSSDISLSTLGRPMRVEINPKPTTESPELIPAEVMVSLQADYNLSKNVTLGIVSTVRRVTGKRKIIESGVNTKLKDAAHQLDQFFSVLKTTFVKMKNDSRSEEELTVVYCHDIDGLIKYIKEKRDVDNVLLKIGVDGGRGSLKICLSIQDSSDDSLAQSADLRVKKSKLGAKSKRFLDSGVKKLFLIGIVESCQENYENISKLWSLIGINKIDGKYAVDLKIANILAGIGSHSSTYPCTWCFAPKNELHKECTTSRTIASIKKYSRAWHEKGSKKSDCKYFFNCELMTQPGLQNHFMNFIDERIRHSTSQLNGNNHKSATGID